MKRKQKKYKSIQADGSFLLPIEQFNKDVDETFNLPDVAKYKIVNCLCVLWLLLTNLQQFCDEDGYLGLHATDSNFVFHKIYKDYLFAMIFPYLGKRYKIKTGIPFNYYRIKLPADCKFTVIDHNFGRYYTIGKGYGNLLKSVVSA